MVNKTVHGDYQSGSWVMPFHGTKSIKLTNDTRQCARQICIGKRCVSFAKDTKIVEEPVDDRRCTTAISLNV
ncbi:uncharacterized protein PHALS_15211 [Plasmopara halstedii]|uniref:Uncharacterized protein n=1 Tax=Plasmopara halstedii TaxID=4781 RepID=A0A0P1B5Q3_PLAHL|nr:uncharacterized protein PHALS_15211 [Plasmopara halstedii]CEG49352.1 hypothetical protein PHALS_15211 [Plasmopara halstedii]|eukprot:XP_024585721.1 hypothetical protein PHALS_15211 [Plasmopara halstedii]